MRVVSAVFVLMFMASGCARKAPDTPEPQPAPAPPVASAPAPPQTPAPKAPTPASKPPATGKPATGKPAPQTAKPPAAKAPTAKPAAPAPSTSKAAPRPAPKAPTLDLVALKEQLKATKAVGVFTKLTLKNQVDDLLDRFRDHYAGKGKPSMPELRQSYDMLMMKVLSLLQDHDQRLASDIVASREAIWGLLADPKSFAALDV